MKFNIKVLEYITQLSKNCARLRLKDVLNFKSRYSLILYKWICSWKNKGETFLTTKSLKELFGLKKDTYANTLRFRKDIFGKRTIEKAIKEINEKTDLIVDVKKVKKNNKVLSYHFSWKRKRKSLIA